MKLEPTWAKQFKFIVFEGPDCCGKTTQINSVAQKFEASVVVHFPRLNPVKNETLGLRRKYRSMNPKKAFKVLNETIYNKEFMTKNIVENKNKFSRWFKFRKVIKALKYNILANRQDKLLFLNSIKNIYISFNDFLNFLECPDYKFYYNGNLLTVDSSIEKLKSFYNFICENPEKFYIFMDRFYISGTIYNKEILKNIWSKNYKDYTPFRYTYKVNKLLDTEDVTKNTIIDILKDLFTPEYSDFRTSIIIPKNVRLNMITFLFKYSERIYQTALKDDSRDITNYDSDSDIKTSVREAYVEYMKHLDPYKTRNFTSELIVDTDNYIESVGLESSRNIITEDIYYAIKENYNKIEKVINEISKLELPSIRYGDLRNPISIE